jgi:hypothetical protein
MGVAGRPLSAAFGLERQPEPRIRKHDIDPPPRRLAVGQPGWRRFGPMLLVFVNGEDVTRRLTAWLRRERAHSSDDVAPLGVLRRLRRAGL